MLVYKVGEVFPHKEQKLMDFDAPRAIIMPNGFFNVVLNSTQPAADKVLTTAVLHVGLYQKDAIPFVLLSWPKVLAFEVVLNIHTASDEFAEAWLNGKGNTIVFFVLEARTNIISAMRTFTIPIALAGQIRDCLEQQDERYTTVADVDLRMEKIMTEVPLRTMIEQTRMYRI